MKGPTGIMVHASGRGGYTTLDYGVNESHPSKHVMNICGVNKFVSVLSLSLLSSPSVPWDINLSS